MTRAVIAFLLVALSPLPAIAEGKPAAPTIVTVEEGSGSSNGYSDGLPWLRWTGAVITAASLATMGIAQVTSRNEKTFIAVTGCTAAFGTLAFAASFEF